MTDGGIDFAFGTPLLKMDRAEPVPLRLIETDSGKVAATNYSGDRS